jgi:CheY-like chemotaxis protein
MIPDSEKFTLLIVGAERFTRCVFQSAATESDCFAEASLAEDAYDALALLWDACSAGCMPDLVVADFDLPGFNAIQFTRELRQHPETRGIFVAILSATPSEMDRVAAETAGADYFEHYANLAALLPIFQTIGSRICRGNVAM